MTPEDDNTTTATSSSSSSSSSPSIFTDDDYKFVWTCISPVILLFGVVGNTLIMIVIGRRSMSGSSTNKYLSAMAVADTAALVLRVVPEWSKSSGLVDFGELSEWTCKVEKFSFYSASDVAIWILVAFTVDRLVAVGFPLRKRQVCTSRKAVAVCCLLVALAVAKNAHVFWTRGLEFDDSAAGLAAVVKPYCGRRRRYRYFEEYVRPWLAFVTVCALPFVVILVCNAYIVRTLAYVRRLRPATACSKRRVSGAASLMCIGASLMFLVCVTPSIALAVGRAYWAGRRGYAVARVVNNQLACLSHAVNLLLYCVTGQRFRRELVDVFGPRCRGAADIAMATTAVAAACRSTSMATTAAVTVAVVTLVYAVT